MLSPPHAGRESGGAVHFVDVPGSGRLHVVQQPDDEWKPGRLPRPVSIPPVH